MSLFDFEHEIEVERSAALTDHERASVRTSLSRQLLPDAVRAAGWQFLDRGDQFDPASRQTALVVGVAPWNAAELHALDALVAAVSDGDVSIWVFDIDNCLNADDIARVLPGVELPTQTPVIAKYVASRLARSAEGAEALELLTHFTD